MSKQEGHDCDNEPMHNIKELELYTENPLSHLTGCFNHISAQPYSGVKATIP